MGASPGQIRALRKVYAVGLLLSVIHYSQKSGMSKKRVSMIETFPKVIKSIQLQKAITAKLQRQGLTIIRPLIVLIL